MGSRCLPRIRSLSLALLWAVEPGVSTGGQLPEGGASTQLVAAAVVVDRRVIEAALEALPRRPPRLIVIDDALLPPAIQRQLRDLDAFVPRGESTIYLRRQSRTLREAEDSGGPYLLMLAVVLWHETAHVEGLDEAHARRREEDLWERFVRTGRVDSSLGLTYLAELKRRPPTGGSGHPSSER